MKFFILVAAACLSLASGKSISKEGIIDNDTLVAIKIPGAHLVSEAKAVLRQYFITPFNSSQKFVLPLNDSQLDWKAIYVRNVENSGTASKSPKWSLAVAPSKPFFSVNSYIAIEIWNDVSANGQAEVLQFVGGSIFTVKHLEQLPNATSIQLLNANGVSAGTVDVHYSLPKN